MFTLSTGHDSSEFGVSESDRHNLRCVLGPRRPTQALAQPFGVIASFGFINPLVDLLVRYVLPLNLPFHTNNRNTNQWAATVLGAEPVVGSLTSGRYRGRFPGEMC